MTLTEEVAKKIIKKLLSGEDYRVEIVSLINAEFLQFTIEFFKKIFEAKIDDDDITIDWYKKVFMDEALPKDEIAINSGLNMKTIGNMYNTTKKEVVLDASLDHFETLYDSINKLIDVDENIDLTITIKFKKLSVDLNVSESLIVINTLAVKRAALRGALWSTAGKRVEKPLMHTLCKLFSVPDKNIAIEEISQTKSKLTFQREVDFYLVNGDKYNKCEVKLMGKGNPESADAVIARDSSVFVADKLSQTNKNQLESRGVEWVELRDDYGFRKFKNVLEKLKIPHKMYNGDINKDLDRIFKEIF